MSGQRSALIVASNEYHDPRLRRLRETARDAEALGRVLADSAVGGFEVEVVSNEPHWVVARRIAGFFNDRRPDDLALLYLSGHGIKDDEGHLHFAAGDTELDSLEATAVAAGFVNRQMSRTRSRRVVLLLDCCYSGAFAQGMGGAAKDDKAVHLRDQFGGRDRVVLTASKATEYSFEGGQVTEDAGQPSVFTPAIIRGLETGEADRNGDGLVSLDELYDYVYDQVRRGGTRQTPAKWAFGVEGELLVARSVRRPSVEPLPLSEDLTRLLREPYPASRLGAVAELEALLQGGEPEVVLTAWHTLEQLKERDDSLRVRAAADAVLDRAGLALPTAEGDAVATAPEEEPPELPRHAATRRRRKLAAQRHINVSIASAVGGPPIPMTANLELFTSYWLRIDIGILSPESAVVNAREQPFPDWHLPRSEAGHWLEVLAVSDDITVDRTRRWLFLPITGQSWVCPCAPGGTHSCSNADRQDHLYLPMTTGTRPVVATVRLSVYFRNNCLQSQLLTTNVGGAAEAVNGYSSFIDYSLTSEFESLESLPARSMNILTNETSSGAHRVIVTGWQQKWFGFSIGDLPIRNLLDTARKSLIDVHLQKVRTGWKTRYDSEHRKPPKEFEQDLRRLARAGGQLYQSVFPTREAQRQLRSFLCKQAQDLRRPAIIQVAQASGSRIVLPWQLFYDIPVGNHPEKYAPCPFLVDWLQGGMPALIPATCPCEHERDTLCPFGFWGFAHIIEVPPSSLDHPLALYVTPDNPPVRLVVGLSTKLDPSLSGRHLSSLIDCLGLAQHDMARCSSMTMLESSLAGSDIDVVYFYCHGRRLRPEGASSDIPALEIGKAEQITPMEINGWKSDWPDEHWERRRPVVVLNGCHTNELTPEEVLSFVTAFSDAKAAGVVGTETSIEQGLAGTAMEWFLSSLKQGKELGEAMYQLRWQLLRRYNLMGLTYTPYCSATLRLRLEQLGRSS